MIGLPFAKIGRITVLLRSFAPNKTRCAVGFPHKLPLKAHHRRQDALHVMVLISAVIAPHNSMSPMGSETVASESAASSECAPEPFFGRRFGKGLVSMIVVPAATGSGCLMYDGQCRGWRGSVVRDYRTMAWRRPSSA
jgi:hypothetical protein